MSAFASTAEFLRYAAGQCEVVTVSWLDDDAHRVGEAFVSGSVRAMLIAAAEFVENHKTSAVAERHPLVIAAVAIASDIIPGGVR